MKSKVFNGSSWQDTISEFAKKLQNAVNISLSGVTSTPQPFDGSADVTIPITEVPANLLTGIISTENLPDSIPTYSAPDELYEGTDLTVKFVSEIAEYNNDPWQWIKARIAAVNWKGLKPGDYIPFTLTDVTDTEYNMHARIAGIDTYYNCGDTPIPHHIDFICKETFPHLSWTDGSDRTTQWNTTNNNNGNASEPCPYLVSNLYNVYNNVIINYLPANLQSVLAVKRVLLEQRYSSSGTLTSSNSWSWEDIGKLWAPSEVEVYGFNCWGTHGYSVGFDVQYPIFNNRASNRLCYTPDGSRTAYWLRTVSDPHSGSAAHVDYSGTCNTSSTSYANIRAALGFRII